MNLVLFEADELNAPLPRSDPRARHILDVLRRGEGDVFDAGFVNGPRGKATVAAINPDSLALTFAWDAPQPPLPPTTLLIGLPRPQTARDILRDATTLGATCIHFIATERADRNYATSSLWTSGEWRRHCLAGAAQAFDTRVPEVTWTHTLASALGTLPDSSTRLALDNYEASTPLQVCKLTSYKPSETNADQILAFGPERGFGSLDRDNLRATGFALVHLGPRVLRVETAVIAALAILRAR
ncbi:RsmE family RNA methyltransferase [Rariglobus hedericola]|uniref:Ribosomal RNA small subunit methyltransferase E n=1 Tax=Rariglobus hedericola TaxID=2597822 RepID=A0A556QRZ8_9BACT|nr:RsmE family RNA methyltransferase [Rariglobus hedericola]TSJ79393.1 RNA methyltransferase [Rariglobus hedericola]